MLRGRRDRLGSLKVLTCGAASMDADTMSDLIGAGFFICQMYGLTESVGDGAWNNSQDLADIHSVGLRDPKREYKLDNGELCIRGDSVMMGYYKDPEGTAEVLDAEGWLHTGDLARIDERGYIFLTGRKAWSGKRTARSARWSGAARAAPGTNRPPCRPMSPS